MDQLSFKSDNDVQIEETSDEGEPEVFNYDNLAEQFKNQGVVDPEALNHKNNFGSFISTGSESVHIE